MRFGYSCQSHLALEVYAHVFGTAWIWFTTHFYPVHNVYSSNAARLYLDLSEAVQRKDIASKNILGYRQALLDAIARHVPDQNELFRLRDLIFGAPIENYRPRIWLLDLALIAERRGASINELLNQLRRNANDVVSKNPGQTLQDEYLIKDAQPDEYSVVVDG